MHSLVMTAGSGQAGAHDEQLGALGGVEGSIVCPEAAAGRFCWGNTIKQGEKQRWNTDN
jgi:hypothetical protein